MSCPECPACRLVKWLEEQIDNLTDEELIKGFIFNIPLNIWKSNDFDKKKINRALITMKYRIRGSCITYNRSSKIYSVKIEFSGI
jgi:hypothetical protein